MVATNISIQTSLEEAVDRELVVLESNEKLTSEDLEDIFKQIAKLQQNIDISGQLLWLENLNKELEKEKTNPVKAVKAAWNVLEKYIEKHGYTKFKDGWIPPSYITKYNALNYLLDTLGVKYDSHMIEPYERVSEISDEIARRVKTTREKAVETFKKQGASKSQARQAAEKLINFNTVWADSKRTFNKNLHNGKSTKGELGFEWDVLMSKNGLLLEREKEQKVKVLKATSNPHQYIIEIPLVTDRYAANKLINAPVTWTSPSGKETRGKIVRAHGNSGKAIAHFKKGLPGQAIPGDVSAGVDIADNSAPRMYFTKDAKELYDTLRKTVDEKNLRVTAGSAVGLEDALDILNDESGMKHQFDHLEIPKRFAIPYFLLRLYMGLEPTDDTIERFNKKGGVTLVNKKSGQEIETPEELAKYWAMFKAGTYEEIPNEKEMLAKIIFELESTKQNKISQLREIASEKYPDKSLEWVLGSRKNISDDYEMREDALWVKYNDKPDSWYRIDLTGNVIVEDKDSNAVKADDLDLFEITSSVDWYNKASPKLRKQANEANKCRKNWYKLHMQHKLAERRCNENPLKKNRKRRDELKKKEKNAWGILKSAEKEFKKNKEWKVMRDCVVEDLKSKYKETLKTYLENKNNNDEIDIIKQQIDLIKSAEDFAENMHIKNNVSPEKARDFLDLYDFLRADAVTDVSYKQYSQLRTQLETLKNKQDKKEYLELKKQFKEFLDNNPKYKLLELRNEIKDYEQELEEVIGVDWETRIHSDPYHAPTQELINEYVTAQKKYREFLDELPHFDALLIEWDPKGIKAETENGYFASWHGKNFYMAGVVALPGDKMSKVVGQELTQEQANVLHALSLYQRGATDYTPRLEVLPEG